MLHGITLGLIIAALWHRIARNGREAKTMTRFFYVALAAAALLGGTAQAQISDNLIKIGVMNDMSGPFEDVTGAGGLLAARMAVEDFGGTVKGAKIEVIGGDHQNKPDIASGLARRWFDEEHVDAIVEVPVSSAAIAVLNIAREKNKAFL